MSQIPLLNIAEIVEDPSPQRFLSAVISPLQGEYLYGYDPAIHPGLQVGSIVMLPLGKRRVPGFVISKDSAREAKSLAEMGARSVKIKSIASEPPPIAAFSAQHLEFFEWIAKYYAEPLSKVLDLAIPLPAFGRSDPMLRAVAQTTSIELGAIKLKAAQRRVFEQLVASGGWIQISRLRKLLPASALTINSLIKIGLIEQQELPDNSQSLHKPDLTSLYDTLTAEQKQAVDQICKEVRAESFSSFLLHGVTGSGKTEVYLEVIIEALKHGRSALIVVPEIALTPQLIERFEARLKQPVALLHSGLKPSERWQHWANLLAGRVRVAIGARSAIFAPIDNLGAIVIDEEHDHSFKQGEGLRYNARDLAIVRAKISKCPIILGSATPSLETYHHAKTGKHVLLALTHRFYTSPPLIYKIIDLNKIKPWEMSSKSVSPQLLQGLQNTLSSGEQAFVLYNRRGFATYMQCSTCEHVVGCPHCSVTLTYHQKNNSLLCHFCGFSTPPPVICAGCGAREDLSLDPAKRESIFTNRGAGTERVYEELATLLPAARLAKLDRDSVRSIADYTDILGRVRERSVDILVGTQMIAKGHDLPDVTFVGIVDCDVGLHVPDFRAAERAFQLLTQVSGRAGRREKQGQVALQTRVPTHLSLQQTVRADYFKFAELELDLRKKLNYPPFHRLLRVIIAAEDKITAQKASGLLAAELSAICLQLGVTMLGPAPAPIEKVRSLWRYHILCKAPTAALLQHVMQRIKRQFVEPKNIRLVFDLDPQDML